MSHDVVVLGGGLSGLAAADLLVREGASVRLLEARSRVGGRILTADVGGVPVDLGPGWVWPHNTRMHALVERFGLQVFEQHARGRLVFEDQAGMIRRDLDLSTMGGALRVAGGLGNVASALAATLPDGTILLGHRVETLSWSADQLSFRGRGPDGAFDVSAEKAVVAAPPRVLAEGLTWEPALPPDVQAAMKAVPTWMAGMGKVLATFPTPFWREQGLSGDAVSHRGPMVEMHDASPAAGSRGALMGFTPPGMLESLGNQRDSILKDQLVRMFGAEPSALAMQDWSTEPDTAVSADLSATGGHPVYGPMPGLANLARGRIAFAGTELAPDEGGFLEGALSAAEAAVTSLAAETGWQDREPTSAKVRHS